MIPLIGISVFLTLFLVKKVSLKRIDDADKKAEAKAWVEEKKQKRAEKKNHAREPSLGGGSHTSAEEQSRR
jgi:hypothetical protein